MAAFLSVPGSVWQLGPHRLVCGSAESPEAVAAAVDGRRIDLLLTDPPYGVALAERAGQRVAAGIAKSGAAATRAIANDDLPCEDMERLWRAAFRAVFAHMSPGASYYVFGPQGGDLLVRMQLALRGAGFPLRHQLIWRKDQFVLSRCDYHYAHEPILYGWVEGAAHVWLSDRKQTSVWEFPRPRVSKLHPTMKPVEMLSYAIGNSCRPDGLVFDPFLGSGSTLMAAEQTGRRCSGTELSPRYSDVICARYQRATGTMPVDASTGVPVDFTGVLEAS